MKIALVAHDKKKESMVNFTIAYQDTFKKYDLVSTGTTGKKIQEATGLKLTRFNSGPLGGDQQVGAEIAQNKVDLVIFLRDPLTAQPHEPDILALLRLCDVYKIPVATNIATAEILLRAMERGEFHWREIIPKYE
ncbi:methylglyoxal synthase [Anaerophilus nitritogenes]|uniref:methylglyoxal synthase n=1 Tax=Anaerophilus nitritogenes TaxID=2498136 RepID=UPI00101C6ADE|nr:methylglyoxal synthase [Anaerophilus nitritogenes]